MGGQFSKQTPGKKKKTKMYMHTKNGTKHRHLTKKALVECRDINSKKKSAKKKSVKKKSVKKKSVKKKSLKR